MGGKAAKCSAIAIENAERPLAGGKRQLFPARINCCIPLQRMLGCMAPAPPPMPPKGGRPGSAFFAGKKGGARKSMV